MQLLAKIIIAPLIFVLSSAGYAVTPQNTVDEMVDKISYLDSKVTLQQAEIDNNEQKLESNERKLGAFTTTSAGTYRLSNSISSTATTINLSSFKEPISNIAYTMSYIGTSVAYGTLDPQNSTKSETISFTGITQNANGTAQLTGVTRGLSRTPSTSSCTASTTLASSHSGQTIFILSNPSCFYSEFAVKRNDETITGDWLVPVPANATSVVNRNYVDGIAFSGVGLASETATGTVEIATGLEAASSTLTGTLGRLVIGTAISTSTYNSATAELVVPTTQKNGYISGKFIFGSASPTTLATTTFLSPNITFATGSSTLVGSTTIGVCINCGNSVIYVPATQFASTTITALGNSVASNGQVGSATSTYWNMQDAVESAFAVGVQVPKAVTQLTAIKVIYSQQSTGDVQLFMTTSYASSTYPTTPSLDSTAGINYTGGGTDQLTNAITLSATGFDNLGRVTVGGIINLQVGRNGSTGGDTYAATLKVYGVEFTFN